MKKFYNYITIGSIILDVVFIIFGLFLISSPEIGTKVGLNAVGIIFLVSGIYSVCKYILDGSRLFFLEFIYGILSIILGLVAIINPFTIAGFITIIVGIWLIINSLIKCLFALEFKKHNESSWLINIVISFVTLFVGIMLIINPFVNYMVITTYVGIMLVIYAGFDLVNQLLFRKRIDSIIKFLK